MKALVGAFNLENVNSLRRFVSISSQWSESLRLILLFFIYPGRQHRQLLPRQRRGHPDLRERRRGPGPLRHRRARGQAVGQRRGLPGLHRGHHRLQVGGECFCHLVVFFNPAFDISLNIFLLQ